MSQKSEGGEQQPIGDQCRLCNKSNASIQIFENNGQNVAVKINRMFPFKVSSEDPFSKLICKECLNSLNYNYEFLKGIVNGQPERIRALPTPFDDDV